jgi:hypothetical protein
MAAAEEDSKRSSPSSKYSRRCRLLFQLIYSSPRHCCYRQSTRFSSCLPLEVFAASKFVRDSDRQDGTLRPFKSWLILQVFLAHVSSMHRGVSKHTPLHYNDMTAFAFRMQSNIFPVVRAPLLVRE